MFPLGNFFELREEVKALLKKRDYDLSKKIESQEFNQILAYLSDIFTRMNDLSFSMQEKNISILKCREKLNAFKEKLHLWCPQVKKGNVYKLKRTISTSGGKLHFPSLEEIVDDDESLISSVCKEIVDHWKYCQSHLVDILEEENWKLLKNGLQIHTPLIWIICRIMKS